MKKIIVNAISREKRIAVLEENQLQHISFINDHQQSLVGNIYAAVVEKIVPGMDAAFVNFGREKRGFLHKADLISSALNGKEVPINQLVKQGEKILIQVIRDETEHKGARVTGFVEISTPYLVYTPYQKFVAVSKKVPAEERQKWRQLALEQQKSQEGMLIRTEMSEKDEAFFIEQLEVCRATYIELTNKLSSSKIPSLLFQKNQLLFMILNEMRHASGTIYIDDFSVFQHLQERNESGWDIQYERGKENIFSKWDIEHQLEKLYKRVVWLDHGSFIVIEEGEAMTTIDVNTGKNTGKYNKAQTIRETNLLAAKEAMRQIKLRNISGMILIDFINNPVPEDKHQVIKVIEQCIQQDATTVKIIGYTELGILQLTRKVSSPSLLQSSTLPCPTCHGTGRVESAEATAFRMEREVYQYRNGDYTYVEIAVSKDVLALFTGENSFYKEKLEADTGLEIKFIIADNKYANYHISKLS